MAESRSALNEKVKQDFIADLIAWLKERGEDVMQVKSNEVAFPFVNAGQMDEWMVLTCKVPTGTRDGEPYDGYGEAETYKMKLESDKEKAATKAAEKAKKIARDKATREKQAAAKAEEQARRDAEEK